MKFKNSLTKSFAAAAIAGTMSTATPAQADGFNLSIDLGNGGSIGIDIDGNGKPQVDLNVDGGNFSFGNGERSAANWQACRNDAVARYNRQIDSDQGVTPQDTARHNQRLRYCNTLYPQ